MSGGSIAVKSSPSLPKNYLPVTVDFSNATWNTIGTHEVLTITGAVHLVVIPRCTEDLVAGAGGTISVGFEGALTGIIGATLFSLIDAGMLFLTTTPATNYATSSIIDKVVDGLDFGYEILVNAFTDGTIKFLCYWEAVEEDNPGTVVAGAGGSL